MTIRIPPLLNFDRILHFAKYAESLKENMDIFGGYFDRIDPY